MLRYAGLLLLCGLLSSGCKNPDNFPQLLPIKGKVVRKGELVKEGMIKLLPTGANEDLLITGLVDASGRFELTTSRDNKKAIGAPAGTYQVMYMPPGDDQQGVTPVMLAQQVTIDGNNNELTIDLQHARAP